MKNGCYSKVLCELQRSQVNELTKSQITWFSAQTADLLEEQTGDTSKRAENVPGELHVEIGIFYLNKVKQHPNQGSATPQASKPKQNKSNFIKLIHKQL